MTALVPSIDLRRALVALAAMASLAVVLVLWDAGPAGAETATPTAPGDGALIDGTSPATGPIEDKLAAEIVVEIDGRTSIAYCISLNLPLVADPLEETTWEAINDPNLGIVAAILNTYAADTPGSDPAGYELVGDADERAAAIQAAIWYFTDDFDLTTGGNIATNYDTIIAAQAAGELNAVDTTQPTVDIVPASQTGLVGQVVGPYTLQASVASAEVTVTGGELVTWPAGDPLSGPLAAGTQFGVVRGTEGAVTISAAASRTAGPSRVFGGAPVQPVMLVEPTTLSASATATATVEELAGSITLEKEVAGAYNADGTPRPTEFVFDIEGPGGFTDTVTLPQGGSWSHTWTGLAAGEYTITERDAGDPESSPTGVPVTVTLAPGGTTSTTVSVTNDYFEGPDLSATASGSCEDLSASVSNDGDVPATVQVTVRDADGDEQTSDLVVGAGVTDLDVDLPADATYVRVSYQGETLAEASVPTDCDEDEVGGITTPRQQTPDDDDDGVGGTTLPRTGTDPHHLAAAGVGLALLGAAMMLGARRPMPLGAHSKR